MEEKRHPHYRKNARNTDNSRTGNKIVRLVAQTFILRPRVTLFSLLLISSLFKNGSFSGNSSNDLKITTLSKKLHFIQKMNSPRVGSTAAADTSALEKS